MWIQPLEHYAEIPESTVTVFTPIAHQKPDIRFVGSTPQEAVNARGFVLSVRISDRKGLRTVITYMRSCGREAVEPRDEDIFLR